MRHATVSGRRAALALLLVLSALISPAPAAAAPAGQHTIIVATITRVEEGPQVQGQRSMLLTVDRGSRDGVSASLTGYLRFHKAGMMQLMVNSLSSRSAVLAGWYWPEVRVGDKVVLASRDVPESELWDALPEPTEAPSDTASPTPASPAKSTQAAPSGPGGSPTPGQPCTQTLAIWEAFLAAQKKTVEGEDLATLRDYIPPHAKVDLDAMLQVVRKHRAGTPQAVADLLALAQLMAQHPNVQEMQFEWSYGVYLGFADVTDVALSLNETYRRLTGSTTVENLELGRLLAEITVAARDVGLACASVRQYQIAQDKLEGALAVSRFVAFEAPYNPLEAALYEDLAGLHQQRGDEKLARAYQDAATAVKAGQTVTPPAPKTDPVYLCSEGEQKLDAGNLTEASRLLEAGFALRGQAAFSGPAELCACALALGRLRKETGDLAGAEEAYLVALDAAQQGGDRAFEAAALNNLGSLRDAQGRYVEALDFVQKAIAAAQGLADRSLDGSLQNNLGTVYAHQGRRAEALAAQQEALTAARAAGDEELELAVLVQIGLLEAGEARYAAAEEILQTALKKARSLANPGWEGDALLGLSQLYYDEGRYQLALDACQEALAAARRAGDQAQEGFAENATGALLMALGRYGEAASILQEALALARSTGSRPLEGVTLANLGGVYLNQGRYGEALATLGQALAIVQALGDGAAEANIRNSLGLTYQRLNDDTNAIAVFREVLTQCERNGGWLCQTAALNNMALAQRAQGDFESAEVSYRRVLATAREVGNRAVEGAALHNLGGLYQGLGRRQEALDLYQQALACRRETGDRLGEGATLGYMGVVYTEEGRFAEAETALRQALAALVAVGDREGQGVTLGHLGDLYEAQNDLARALATYEQAMTVLEGVRAGAGNDQARAGFFEQYAAFYDHVVMLYHRAGRDADAFRVAERGRARSFLDSLATGQVELGDDEAKRLLEREGAAYAASLAAEQWLAHARSLNPPDPDAVDEAAAQLAAASGEYDAAIAAIEAHGGQLVALTPARSATLDLAGVQELLDDQTTLVSYELTPWGTLAFVITRSKLAVIELPEATLEHLGAAVSNFYLVQDLDTAHPLALRDLYGWLVAPLAGQLTTPRVGIIPHRLLHYVPFAALTDGAHYFGEQHELFALPSASALRFTRANAAQRAAPGRTPALVFGNATSEDRPMPLLVHAEAEARSIAGMLGVKAFTEADASETRFRAGVRDAAVVHLAVHGAFSARDPLQSAVYLAQGGEHDGTLSVREIYGLQMPACNLVVLSACESQQGSVTVGDEMVSLPRAFIYAGAPSVLATLWSVDDEATGALMTRLYTHLREGMGKARALQAAQADLRADTAHPQWANPYFWGAFVLSGDPGAMALPSRSLLARVPLWAWAVLAAVAVVAIILLRGRR